MDEIEYLEEYEDLILPTMSSQSAATKSRATSNLVSMADDEDSSSIDQDIFESLFDDHSDDESVMQKKVPAKLSQRNEHSSRMSRVSMDSIDLLVKDLGEPLNTQAIGSKPTNKPTPKPCITKSTQPNKVIQKVSTTSTASVRGTSTSTLASSDSKVSNKSETATSSADRNSKTKSIATVRPTVQQNLPQAPAKQTNANTSDHSSNRPPLNSSTTSTQNAKVSSGSQNQPKTTTPGASTSRKQIAVATSTTGSTSSGALSGSKGNAPTSAPPKRIIERSQTTIIKPEKPQIKDPAEDPLSLENIENDSDSDTDSFIYSDISADTFVSLSDVDDEERQVIELSNDSNYDRVNLDKIRGSTPSPTVSDDDKSDNEDSMANILPKRQQKSPEGEGEGTSLERNANVAQKLNADTEASTSGQQQKSDKPSSSKEKSKKLEKSPNASDTLLDRIDTVLSESVPNEDEEVAIVKQMDDVELEVQVTSEDETKEKNAKVTDSAMECKSDMDETTNTEAESNQEPSKTLSMGMEMEEIVEVVEQQNNDEIMEVQVEVEAKAEEKIVETTDNANAKSAGQQTIDDDVVLLGTADKDVADSSVTEIINNSDVVAEETSGDVVESGEDIELSENLEIKQSELDLSADNQVESVDVNSTTESAKETNEKDVSENKGATIPVEQDASEEVQGEIEISQDISKATDPCNANLDEETKLEKNSTEKVENREEKILDNEIKTVEDGKIEDKKDEQVASHSDKDADSKITKSMNKDEVEETSDQTRGDEIEILEQEKSNKLIEEKPAKETPKVEQANTDSEKTVVAETKPKLEKKDEPAISTKTAKNTQDEKDIKLATPIKTRKMEKPTERETRSQTPKKAKQIDSKTRSQTPMKANQAESKTRSQTPMKSKQTESKNPQTPMKAKQAENETLSEEKKAIEKASGSDESKTRDNKKDDQALEVEPKTEIAASEVANKNEQPAILSIKELDEKSLPSISGNQQEIEAKKNEQNVKKSITDKTKSELKTGINKPDDVPQTTVEKADTVEKSQADDTKQIDKVPYSMSETPKSTTVEINALEHNTKLTTEEKPLENKEVSEEKSSIAVERNVTETPTPKHDKRIRGLVVSLKKTDLSKVFNEKYLQNKDKISDKATVESKNERSIDRAKRESKEEASKRDSKDERTADKAKLDSKDESSSENAKRYTKDEKPVEMSQKESKNEQPQTVSKDDRAKTDLKDEKVVDKEKRQSKDERSVERAKRDLKAEKSAGKEKRDSKDEDSTDHARRSLRDEAPTNQTRRNLKDERSAERTTRDTKHERSTDRAKRDTRGERSTDREKRDTRDDRSTVGAKRDTKDERYSDRTKRDMKDDRYKRDTRDYRSTDRGRRDMRDDRSRRDEKDERSTGRAKRYAKDDRSTDRAKRDMKDDRSAERAKRDTKDDRSTERAKRDTKDDKYSDRAKRDTKDDRSTDRAKRDTKDDRFTDKTKRDSKDDKVSDCARKHEKSADKTKTDEIIADRAKRDSKDEKATDKAKGESKDEKLEDKSKNEKSTGANKDSRENSVEQIKRKELEKGLGSDSAVKEKTQEKEKSTRGNVNTQKSIEIDSGKPTVSNINTKEKQTMEDKAGTSGKDKEKLKQNKVEQKEKTTDKTTETQTVSRGSDKQQIEKCQPVKEGESSNIKQIDKPESETLAESSDKTSRKMDAENNDKYKNVIQGKSSNKSEDKPPTINVDVKPDRENAAGKNDKEIESKVAAKPTVKPDKTKAIIQIISTEEPKKIKVEANTADKISGNVDEIIVLDSSDSDDSIEEVPIEALDKRVGSLAKKGERNARTSVASSETPKQKAKANEVTTCSLRSREKKAPAKTVIESSGNAKEKDKEVAQTSLRAREKRGVFKTSVETSGITEKKAKNVAESSETSKEEKVKVKEIVHTPLRTREKKVEGLTLAESKVRENTQNEKVKATEVVQISLRTREKRGEAKVSVENTVSTEEKAKTSVESSDKPKEDKAKAKEVAQISRRTRETDAPEEKSKTSTESSDKFKEEKVKAKELAKISLRTRETRGEAKTPVESTDDNENKSNTKEVTQTAVRTREKRGEAKTPFESIDKPQEKAKSSDESFDESKDEKVKAKEVPQTPIRTREKRGETKTAVEDKDITAEKAKPSAENLDEPKEEKVKAKEVPQTPNTTREKRGEAKTAFENKDVTEEKAKTSGESLDKSKEEKTKAKEGVQTLLRTREKRGETKTAVGNKDITADKAKTSAESLDEPKEETAKAKEIPHASLRTREKRVDAKTSTENIKDTVEKAKASAKSLENHEEKLKVVESSLRTREKRGEAKAPTFGESLENPEEDKSKDKDVVQTSLRTREKRDEATISVESADSTEKKGETSIESLENPQGEKVKTIDIIPTPHRTREKRGVTKTSLENIHSTEEKGKTSAGSSENPKEEKVKAKEVTQTPHRTREARGVTKIIVESADGTEEKLKISAKSTENPNEEKIKAKEVAQTSLRPREKKGEIKTLVEGTDKDSEITEEHQTNAKEIAQSSLRSRDKKATTKLAESVASVEEKAESSEKSKNENKKVVVESVVKIIDKKSESDVIIQITEETVEHKSTKSSAQNEPELQKTDEIESKLVTENMDKNVNDKTEAEGTAVTTDKKPEVVVVVESADKLNDKKVNTDSTTASTDEKSEKQTESTVKTENKKPEAEINETKVSEGANITRLLRKNINETKDDGNGANKNESNKDETSNKQEEQMSKAKETIDDNEYENEVYAESAETHRSQRTMLKRAFTEALSQPHSPETPQTLSASEEEHEISTRRSLRKRAADHSPSNSNELAKKGLKSHQMTTSALTNSQKLAKEQWNSNRGLSTTPTLSATRKRARDLTPNTSAEVNDKEKSPSKKHKLEPLRKSTRIHNDDVDTSEGELDNSIGQRRARLAINRETQAANRSTTEKPTSLERGRSTQLATYSPKTRERPTSTNSNNFKLAAADAKRRQDQQKLQTTRVAEANKKRTKPELEQLQPANKIARSNEESVSAQRTATKQATSATTASGRQPHVQRPEAKTESAAKAPLTVGEASDPLQIPIKRLRRLQPIDGLETVNVVEERKVDEVDKKNLTPKRKSLRAVGQTDTAKDVEMNKTQQQKGAKSGEATTAPSKDQQAGKESSKQSADKAESKDDGKSAASTDRNTTSTSNVTATKLQPSPTKSPGSKVITFTEWLEQQKKGRSDDGEDVQVVSDDSLAATNDVTVTTNTSTTNAAPLKSSTANEVANVDAQHSEKSADTTAKSSEVEGNAAEMEIKKSSGAREVRDSSRRRKDVVVTPASNEKTGVQELVRQTPTASKQELSQSTTNTPPTQFKRPSLPQRSARGTPARYSNRTPTPGDSGKQATLHKVDPKWKLRKLRVRVNRSTVLAYFNKLSLNMAKAHAVKTTVDPKVVPPSSLDIAETQPESIDTTQKRSRQRTVIPTITSKRVALKPAAQTTLPQLPTLTARPPVAAAASAAAGTLATATTSEDVTKVSGPLPKLTKDPSVLETLLAKPQNEPVTSPITAAGYQNSSSEELSLLTPMKTVAVTSTNTSSNIRSQQPKQQSALGTAAEAMREKRSSATSSTDSSTTQRSQPIGVRVGASSSNTTITTTTPTTSSGSGSGSTKDAHVSFTAVVPKEEIVDEHQQQTQEQSLLRSAVTASTDNTATTNSLASRTLALAAATNSALNQTPSSDPSGYYGLTPTVLDTNGTRLYSFLHPAKYNRNHGCVLLDYCCPNLDGPMPAIDPTRIHAQVQAGVRELPAYIVMTTKLITRADLEANKNVIPASIRQKVEKITADASANLSTTTVINGTPNASMSIPTTPQLTPAPKSSLTPTITALQKHLPPNTIITPKFVPSTSSGVMASPLNALSSSMQSSGTPTTTTSQMSLSDYQRSLLRTSVRQFDARLKKYYYRVAMLSFSDRQIIIDNIINSTTLTPKDIECAVRLIDEYASQISLLPVSAAGGGTPKPTTQAIQSVSRAITTPTTNTIVRTTTIQQQQQQPQQQQQVQKQNQNQQISKGPIGILDKDNSILGYQLSSSTNALSKSTVSTRSSIMSTTTSGAKNTSLPNVTTTSSSGLATLKAAQDSPRIFYTKPPMQTSTPIANNTSSGSTAQSGAKTIALRSTPRLGRELTIRQIPTKFSTVSSTTVTATPPASRRFPQLTRNPHLATTTTSNTTPNTSIANTSSTSDTITTRSAVTISTAPKRMTRASAAAKVIVITQNTEGNNAPLDECILPDGNENAEIKRERIDDDFVGGN